MRRLFKGITAIMARRRSRHRSRSAAAFKGAAALLVVLHGLSCFGTVSDPVRHYYTLHLEPLHQVPSPHINGLLRVRDLDSDAAYDRFQIVMRRSPFELSYRQSDVWAVKPNRMVSDLLARGLADQNVFAAVTRELSERRPDYLLSGELHAIEVYDSDDMWFAHIAMSLQITHFESGKILWTFNYDDRKNVTSGNFSHVVRALSELLSTSLEKALTSMEHMRSPDDVAPEELQEAPFTTKPDEKAPGAPVKETPLPMPGADVPLIIPEKNTPGDLERQKGTQDKP